MSWKIKTGSASTAGWAHLVESTDSPAPQSVSINLQNADSLVWEARTGEHWDAPNHQKVIFEYPTGTVRFRGRFKSSGGMGRPGGQGWVFRCVGMRGLARLVDVDDGDTGYPERIYNADTQDSDYHRSIFNADGSKMDVGEILKDLFDEFKTDLDTADATIAGNAAYDQTELDTLSAVPDKVILRETNFENAVVQVLEKQGITFSIWVDPQTGKWHFVDRRSGALPAKTITLGTDTIDSDNIQTSTEDCFTAFKIFGRQGAGAHAVKKKIGHGSDQSGQTLSGLGKCWDPAEEANWTIEKSVGEKDYGEIATIGVDSAPLQQIYVTCTGKDWDVDFWDGTGGSPAMGEAGTVAFPGWNSSKSYEIVSNTADKVVFDAGADYAAILAQISAGGKFTLDMRTLFRDMFRRFYITDTTARDVIESGDYGDENCCPVLWKTGYWSGGSFAYRMGIPVRFEPTTEQWGGADVEVAVVAKYPLYQPAASGADLWDDIAFEYCHRDSADGVVMQARSPASGYTGSAHANHGVEREKTLIVPEFDRPELEADFVALAAILLKPHQDVRAWGSATLRGVDTSFFDPRFRLFIAHASQTIGWATSLNASPVSIRFDLQAETTHIEISNDWRDDLNYADLLQQRIGEKLAEIEAESARRRDEYITCSKNAIGSHESMPIAADKFVEVTGDSGSITADDPEDTFKIEGGTDISAVASGTGAGKKIRLDYTGVLPPTPPIFKTIRGDSGAAVADIVADEITIKGKSGSGITTAASDDPESLEIDVDHPDGVGKIQVDTSYADASQADDTVEFKTENSRLLITIPASKQVQWALTGKSVTIPNPLLTEFKKWVVAGHTAGLTRCDGSTYNHLGNWIDFNSATGCGVVTNPNQAGAKSYQCRSFPDYKNPYSGAAVTIHGIVTRSGSYGGTHNPPGTVHYLFPYICKATGYPSSSIPCCPTATGQKDLLIVTPDDDKVVTGDMTLEDYLPAWLQAYANFIKFTSQGMACLDDRLYNLDANIFGHNGGPANASCGKPGSQTAGMSVLEQLCNCLGTITEYFGDYCNRLDTACSGSCTDCTLVTVGDHGSHNHTCARPISPPANFLATGNSFPSGCSMSWACCPSCGAGGDATCFTYV